MTKLIQEHDSHIVLRDAYCAKEREKEIYRNLLM